MIETYSWTFKFRKVVWKQNTGAVEDFILLHSAVYLQIRKWKNYWNRSTFAKAIVKIKVAPFLWPPAAIVCGIVVYAWRSTFIRCTPHKSKVHEPVTCIDKEVIELECRSVPVYHPTEKPFYTNPPCIHVQQWTRRLYVQDIIMQAVQGHRRSLVLVRIESTYETSY